MTASKIADLYGLAEGNCTQQSDVEMAYVNAKLNTTETWVRLPPDRVPKEFRHLRDPVFSWSKLFTDIPKAGGTGKPMHANSSLRKDGC